MKTKRFNELRVDILAKYKTSEKCNYWCRDTKEILIDICTYIRYLRKPSQPGIKKIIIKLIFWIIQIESNVTGLAPDTIFSRRKKLGDKILQQKALEYVRKDDRLHNFRLQSYFTGKGLIDNIIGNMAKHYSSIVDIVNDGKPVEQKVIDEKFGDFFNYIILLYVAKVEEVEFLVNNQIEG